MSNSSEFLAEAQELIEGYSQNLLSIEAQLRDTGDFDPDLLNGAFRALHTLKSLAAMVGHEPLRDFSHELEDTLDRMRLGKLTLDLRTVDLLFESAQLCEQLLLASGPAPAAEPFLRRLAKLTDTRVEPSTASLGWLDDSILGSLSEFEEHRLRENLRLGRRIVRVHVGFDLMALSTGIDALKQKLKQHGEVISFVPSSDISSDDQIILDVLVGSKSTLDELAASIDEDGVVIEVLGTDERVVIGEQPKPQVIDDEPGPALASPTPDPAPTTPPEPVAERSAPASDPSEHGLRQTVRVDLRKLDLLMNLVGELAVVHTNLDSAFTQRARVDPKNEHNREALEQLRIMSRRLGLLQQEILGVRMVPIGGLCKTLALLVRNNASKLGMEVRFTVAGADTELDKLLIDRLKDLLLFLTDRAMHHAIEMPADRAAVGKPRTSQISFAALLKGNRVVLELTDDGAGIDWRQVRDEAVRLGVVSQHEAQSMTPAQAINLIFKPGLGFWKEGRSFGMDFVKTEIAALSGMIDVSTEPGSGTRFRIVVPITLAIIQALVLDVAGQTFCIPLNSVIESIMVRREDIQTVGGHAVVSVRGRTLPLISLAEVFEIADDAKPSADDRLYVVIVGLAQHRVGLIVDELLGEHDVVIKSIGVTLGRIPGIAGATELGNNRTVLVLDVASLVGETIGEARGLAGTV